MQPDTSSNFAAFPGLPIIADQLFFDLPASVLQSLDCIKHEMRFGKGRAVYSRGDAPGCVFIMRRGTAREIYGRDKEFSRRILPNEIHGLTEVISNCPYKTGIETIGPCIFDCFGRDDLVGFLQADRMLSFRLVEILGRNLHKEFQTVTSSVI